MKTEYTVLQAQTPREKRNEVRRQDDGFREVISDKLIRAIYAFSSDPDDGKSGRDDSAGDMQLQLRPPTDLRGNTTMYASFTSSGIAALGQPYQRR
ncbi:MAG: hypothetical protein EOM14_15370, partial [Clostridia bacterium]|nr:hypothetical protein [Clostridia bacterium]